MQCNAMQCNAMQCNVCMYVCNHVHYTGPTPLPLALAWPLSCAGELPGDATTFGRWHQDCKKCKNSEPRFILLVYVRTCHRMTPAANGRFMIM